MSRRFSLLGLILFLLGSLSCDGQTAPELLNGQVEATFEPLMVGEKIVPFVISTSGDTCTTLQLGSSLTLYGSGKYSLQLNTGSTVCNGIAESAGGAYYHGTYEFTDGVLSISGMGSGLESIEYIPEQGAQGDIAIPGVKFTYYGTEYLMIQRSFEVPGALAPGRFVTRY